MGDDDDFSQTGFLILCDSCGSNTAKHKVGADYFCNACLGNDQESVIMEKPKEMNIICDCGALKVGGRHSDWCSTRSDN